MVCLWNTDRVWTEIRHRGSMNHQTHFRVSVGSFSRKSRVGSKSRHFLRHIGTFELASRRTEVCLKETQDDEGDVEQYSSITVLEIPKQHQKQQHP